MKRLLFGLGTWTLLAQLYICTGIGIYVYKHKGLYTETCQRWGLGLGAYRSEVLKDEVFKDEGPLFGVRMLMFCI